MANSPRSCYSLECRVLSVKLMVMSYFREESHEIDLPAKLFDVHLDRPFSDKCFKELCTAGKNREQKGYNKS